MKTLFQVYLLHDPEKKYNVKETFDLSGYNCFLVEKAKNKYVIWHESGVSVSGVHEVKVDDIDKLKQFCISSMELFGKYKKKHIDETISAQLKKSQLIIC